MRRSTLLNSIVLLAIAGGLPLASSGGQFSDSDVLPTIRALLFSRDAVGFVSSRKQMLGNVPLHFVYERASRRISEVDATEFRRHFPAGAPREEPSWEPSHAHYVTGRTAGGIPYKLKLKFCYDEEEEGKVEVVVGDKPVQVRARDKCTGVSSVEIVNGQLWLGTVQSGEGGLTAAEGIIIQDLSRSRVLARLGDVSGWVSRVHLDPFSGNVWAATDEGIYEISPQFRILAIYRYQAGFDPLSGEPRFAFSSEPAGGHPFSPIARQLPKEQRKGFYEAVSKVPAADLQFRPYDFHMCGMTWVPDSFRPLFPFFAQADGLLACWKGGAPR